MPGKPGLQRQHYIIKEWFKRDLASGMWTHYDHVTHNPVHKRAKALGALLLLFFFANSMRYLR
jgi:hypothetical protein